MILSGVYAITDESLLARENLLSGVGEALSGGAKMVQYRAKLGTREIRFAEAARLVELCTSFKVPLIVNDDVDLCFSVGAHGVHLGQNDTDIASARRKLGTAAIIGISCHADLKLALSAQSDGADYVAFGRFFPSATKPNAPQAALSILADARRTLTIPIVAIGGINAENGAAALEAGADMLAVINFLFAGPGIKQRTAQLAKLFCQNAAPP